MADSSAISHAREKFDWILGSPVSLPPRNEWQYASLADMIWSGGSQEEQAPLLLGADHTGPLEILLRDLRLAVQRARQWCAEQGFAEGDSLLLVRLPHTSEVPLAVAAVVLMSLGIRVVLPMSFDHEALAEMAESTQTRAMLWCTGEVAKASVDQVRKADAMFRTVAAELKLPSFSLDEQLDWHVRTNAEAPVPAKDEIGDAHVDREVLVLSTSGSTGRPKLVRYTEAALLQVAEAWQAAGLMSVELTGGRSLCPALSHSMGFRNVVHAIWNRQPTLLAQPEWLEDKPKKFVKMLEQARPQHITCGPALLRDLALLGRTLQRVKEGLASLRCIVSSGAADIAARDLFPEDVRVANAFGMTEVQQVLSTLLGPPDAPPGALGRPLPGVEVAVQYVEPSRQIGQLFVRSAFKAAGYVGAPDFDAWFPTGDLVQVEGDDLVWVGRVNEDFLSTGQGVKVSLAELRSVYQQLQNITEAILFFSLPSCGGVAAAAYVGEQDPADPTLHGSLLQAIEADHQLLAEGRRDFALEYMAVTVLGCVAGTPPRRGPGKVDRELALEQLADLQAVMADPAAEHAQVLRVPRYGSDRPDWRRFV